MAAAVTVAVGGVLSLDAMTGFETGMSFVPAAYAAEGGSKGVGHQGGMGEGRGGQAGQGGQGSGGQGHKGGKSVKDVLVDDGEEEDSDRPDWAGVPGGEGRPGGGGNPNPGSTKGDIYGDMVMLLRDPVTGLPILDDAGWLQACTSADCSTYVSMVEGEVPAGETTFEVEFGRASVARAPATVVDHALEEAISKLTADGAVLSQDEAGRITITVNGVSSTIDSPLENLALYIDLMSGLASDATSAAEAALGSLATLDTAASLLAGVADKTGDITLDFVVYNNVITGIVDAGDVYSFTGFTYDRAYEDVSYFYTLDGGATVLSATLDVNDYLQAVNGDLPTDDQYAALFTAAADDAVEVIELVHTQVHYLTEPLPGTQ